MTITVAGLWGTGTIAGGKFLTDSGYLREAAKKLPPVGKNAIFSWFSAPR
jgi:hypothetical protein